MLFLHIRVLFFFFLYTLHGDTKQATQSRTYIFYGPFSGPRALVYVYRFVSPLSATRSTNPHGGCTKHAVHL